MPNKRNIPRTCEQCGQSFLAYSQSVKEGKARFCSPTCYGASIKGKRGPTWRGGRYIQDGFIVLRIAGEDVYEHRLVMEQHLGRSLQSNEVVLHINGDKADNRIENLRLMTRSEYMASRPMPSTKIERACEICGKHFLANPGRVNQGMSRFCSTECFSKSRIGITRVTPQNGRAVTARGYVTLLVGINERKYEHRVVMETLLGRPLTKGEIVHHKDGNKANNDPANLQVMTPGEHTLLHAEMRRLRRAAAKAKAAKD